MEGYLNCAKVTVMVGEKKYSLPKLLVCNYSRFFEAAFNGTFKEGVEQEMRSESTTVESFDLAIQWIYSGTSDHLPFQAEHLVAELLAQVSKAVSRARLPSCTLKTQTNSNIGTFQLHAESKKTNSDIVTQILNFLKLADQIDLTGPFDPVLHTMKTILIKDGDALLPEHVRSAVELPEGHKLRTLFAQSCVKSYIATRKMATIESDEFKVQKGAKGGPFIPRRLFRCTGCSVVRTWQYLQSL